MRKASTWMPEKGTQTPSPSPDLIPAEHNNKTLTGNSRANWYIERGHLKGNFPMKNHMKMLEDEISRWPHVSVHEHRFGGHEFLFDKAEVGHVHTGGIVDIPFTRPVRDALLANRG